MPLSDNSASGRIGRDQSRWQSYVLGMRARDPKALAQLYDETSTALYGLALRMLQDPVAAEETMLAVYQQAWQAPQTIAGENVLEFLILQTRSRALEQIRNASTDVSKERSKAVPTSGGGKLKAFEGLTVEEREVVELAFFRGLNAAEIAGALGTPIDTIKKMICAGTGKLREALHTSSQESMH